MFIISGEALPFSATSLIYKKLQGEDLRPWITDNRGTISTTGWAPVIIYANWFKGRQPYHRHEITDVCLLNSGVMGGRLIVVDLNHHHVTYESFYCYAYRLVANGF